MNAQLKKIGMGLALLALPLFAATTNAQWSQQTGVTANLGNAAPATASANTVLIDQYGTLNGRVASIDATSRTAAGLPGLNVFLVKNKQVVKQARTNADGSFSIRGLTEGAYSFYAAGQRGFAAYGIYATRSNTGATSNLLEATTASTAYPAVKQLVAQNVPTAVAQALTAASSQVASTTTSTNQIQLTNGRLLGKVRSVKGSSVAGTQVHLIQNAQPVAQVYTDANGNFSIPDVAPGVYDFIAVGQKGFAATRFEAIGHAGPVTQVGYRRLLAPQDLDVTLAEDEDDDDGGTGLTDGRATGEIVMEPSYSAPVEYAAESVVYGGAAGGAPVVQNVGGGVIRGRFGGLGRNAVRGRGGASRLLFYGGLAGGIIAIATDDEDDASPNGG